MERAHNLRSTLLHIAAGIGMPAEEADKLIAEIFGKAADHDQSADIAETMRQKFVNDIIEQYKDTVHPKIFEKLPEMITSAIDSFIGSGEQSGTCTFDVTARIRSRGADTLCPEIPGFNIQNIWCEVTLEMAIKDKVELQVGVDVEEVLNVSIVECRSEQLRKQYKKEVLDGNRQEMPTDDEIAGVVRGEFEDFRKTVVGSMIGMLLQK